MNPISVTVTSDFICPWCWIGHRNLKEGIRLSGVTPAPRVHYRPFELNPSIPLEGKNRKEYRTAKFGSWARSQAMDADVTAAGKRVGIEFNYDLVERTPNTRLAHRLMALAQEKGDAQQIESLHEAIFSAYFSEGRDIGSIDVLASIAASVGIDKPEASSWLLSLSGETLVAAEEAAASQDGIHGVPAFRIGDSLVHGAQASQVLARELRRAADATSIV